MRSVHCEYDVGETVPIWPVNRTGGDTDWNKNITPVSDLNVDLLWVDVKKQITHVSDFILD